LLEAESEWFEYPAAWEAAYKAKRGSRRYLAQYALMEVLRQRHGIKSLTWLHLASVDRQTVRRIASDEPWGKASPRPSRTDARRTRERAANWETMRRHMGQAFELLQEAIVRARFVGAYQGEPDLFCWTSRGWFFAEAKTPGELILQSQRKWWRVAQNLQGIDCPIFICRVIAKGHRPPGEDEHTHRWVHLMRALGARNDGPLGSANDFVSRVLKNWVSGRGHR
jgi:hypothetical protein